MQCPRCQQENPSRAKFCLERGARLALQCAQCGTELPPDAKFCLECGQAVRAPADGPLRSTAPAAYTPGHLAEKILHARPTLEGERKQVTVLFADLKGSMELLADRDPEESRQILDPVLEQSVRTLVETGVLVGEPGAYRLPQLLASLQVPSTVLAVLAARIDRLPAEAKRLLQTAAVIGTEVPFPLLQAIADLQPEVLHRSLTHLQAAEFLYETSLFPGRCLAERGAFVEGIAHGEEGLRVAERTDDTASLIAAYRDLGHLYLCKGDTHRAIPVLERGLALCQHRDIPAYFPIVAALLGSAYALSGYPAKALPLLEQAMEQGASMRLLYGQSLEVILLGEAYLLTDRMEEARQLALRARDLSHTRKERGYQAYALRLLGEIAARHGPPEVEEAQAHYHQALALAEELGMRPLQAHCHYGLGTLYANAGRPEQARPELSAAIALYRSMDMTFWLPQAAAALEQVSE